MNLFLKYKKWKLQVKINKSNEINLAKISKSNDIKLNIGCGKVKFDGWINIDIDPKADLVLDVTRGLPFKNDSVSFIYNEHFIEHLTMKDGLKLLQEAYRVLKPGGAIRVAAPDLYETVQQYITNSWKNREWIKKHKYEWLETRAEMINLAFREWGHKYLYDEEELERRIKEAGFINIYKQELYKSKYSELQNRETRIESRLIFEAIKH